jgi:hypothetical protein
MRERTRKQNTDGQFYLNIPPETAAGKPIKKLPVKKMQGVETPCT